jgi:hypothetical protein
MHDPNTLAFRPFFWLEIWHVDPCIGGNDDSAGWSTPNMTDKDRASVEQVVKWSTDKTLKNKSSFEIIAWLWGRCLHQREGRNRDLLLGEISYCIKLAANTVDNLDWPIGEARDSDKWQRLVVCVYRAVMRHHRKWWQHPKWNLTRWQVNIYIPYWGHRRLRMVIGRASGESHFSY